MSALPDNSFASAREIEIEQQQDRRTAPRFALLYQAAKLISGDCEFLCVVGDASYDGVRVRHFGHLQDAKSLIFELANGESFPVKLVWSDDEYAGLKFPDEVDIDRLVKIATGEFPKRPLRLATKAEGAVATATQEYCMTIRNISQQGACIECREELMVDQVVRIETDALPAIAAHVRWRLGTIYGLAFEENLSCECLADVVADARRY
jgi:hypothetical protein